MFGGEKENLRCNYVLKRTKHGSHCMTTRGSVREFVECIFWVWGSLSLWPFSNHDDYERHAGSMA